MKKQKTNILQVSLYIGVTIIILAFATLFAFDTFKTDSVKAKVIDLQQQQIIKERTTEYRYLIITDKETFTVKSSIMMGKFNNSDIYYHLKKDSIYTFEVQGVGKGIFTDYRNILSVN